MKISLYNQRQIFISINELSNKELQRQLWLEGGFPNYISTYGELYNILIGDLKFESFVDNDAYDIGYSKEIIQEMKKMKTLLMQYNDKGKSDKQILRDPAWDVVIAQAKVVMDLFWKSNPLGISTFDQLEWGTGLDE